LPYEEQVFFYLMEMDEEYGSLKAPFKHLFLLPVIFCSSIYMYFFFFKGVIPEDSVLEQSEGGGYQLKKDVRYRYSNAYTYIKTLMRTTIL
jgi:hypothetical protein